MTDAPAATTEPTLTAGRPTGRKAGLGLGPGTLGRHLVTQVSLIVAVVAILLSVVTLVAVRQIFVGQVDDQVRAAAARQNRDPGSQDGQGGPPGIGFGGNPIGTVFVVSAPGSDTAVAAIVREGTAGSTEAVTKDATEQLLQVPSDGKIRTVRLDGLGEYRVRSVSSPTKILVTGVPLTEVNSMIKTMALIELAAVLLAIVAAMAISAAIVRRNLRPLNQLADTANQVSSLALDRGEVALPVRVPEQDPRSEVGQVGLAFNHMLNNVEAALSARQQSETKVRQFVADASHELRNPLAAIRGYSELTRRDRGSLPEQTAFAMARIEAESGRMSTLVEDMMLLARLDNDPTLALEVTDVSEIVLNAVSDARVAGPDHQWRVSLPDDPQLAMADPYRLQQVVVNLLSNARRHTPAGTRVTVQVQPATDAILVTVSDNGPGIDPAVLPTVFERFARADAARAHAEEPSTGLGLAIVSAVMSAHHGSVGVESVPGHTQFSLLFPAAR